VYCTRNLGHPVLDHELVAAGIAVPQLDQFLSGTHADLAIGAPVAILDRPLALGERAEHGKAIALSQHRKSDTVKHGGDHTSRPGKPEITDGNPVHGNLHARFWQGWLAYCGQKSAMCRLPSTKC
jgi:hypothetical protein